MNKSSDINENTLISDKNIKIFLMGATGSLENELSNLRKDMSQLQNQIVVKSKEIAVKEKELEERREKKSLDDLNGNMLQKLQNVMDWAKKIEEDCTATKKIRKQQARRINLQLRRRKSFGEDQLSFLSKNSELKLPQLNLPNVSRSCDSHPTFQTKQTYPTHLTDKIIEESIINSSRVQSSRYFQSLQADIEELTVALKTGLKKENQNHLLPSIKVHESDMPLILQRKSNANFSKESLNQLSAQPPSKQGVEDMNRFRRRYYSLDDSASITDLITLPNLPPQHQRPKSEIHFAENENQKFVKLPPIKSYFDKENYSNQNKIVKKQNINRLNVIEQSNAPSRNEKANVLPHKNLDQKPIKVKRLYGEATPVKSPPKKNFGRLLSKSKKLEIQRKLKNLPLKQIR